MPTSPDATPDWLSDPKVHELLAEFTPEESAMTAAEYLTNARIARLRTPDVGPGELAPDFDLPLYDFSGGLRVDTGQSFHLQEVASNTPVALVFGSYT